MTLRLQKLVLLAHIIFSVGWFGAVLPYLAIVVAGLTSHDAQLSRAAYLAMELIGWYVLVPLSFAALLSGLVQSLVTRWGFFRHWWIVTKLALTVFAVVILFQHMREVSRIALVARGAVMSGAEFRPDLLHAVGGLLVLFAVMALSVFKPWGATPYGQRKVALPHPVVEEVSCREPTFATGGFSWARIVRIHVLHAAALGLLLVIVLHLVGFRHH